VAAVVLDHEETHEEACGGHSEQQAYPIPGIETRPHQNPREDKRSCRYHDLKDAAHAIRLAIAAQCMRQRSGIGRGISIVRVLIHA
jgi:hypothetical protein